MQERRNSSELAMELRLFALTHVPVSRIYRNQVKCKSFLLIVIPSCSIENIPDLMQNVWVVVMAYCSVILWLNFRILFSYFLSKEHEFWDIQRLSVTYMFDYSLCPACSQVCAMYVPAVVKILKWIYFGSRVSIERLPFRTPREVFLYHVSVDRTYYKNLRYFVSVLQLSLQSWIIYNQLLLSTTCQMLLHFSNWSSSVAFFKLKFIT